MKLAEDKIKGQKHFANKLWNITRFVLSNIDEQNLDAPLTEADSAVLEDWKTVKSLITDHIEGFRLHIAAEEIYNYIWKVFADKILEESKPLLASDDTTIAASRQALLYTLLTESLKVLHPFMPFVTEALWELIGETLPKTKSQRECDILMVASWDRQ
jgi:valyl-tRNA synthetase